MPDATITFAGNLTSDPDSRFTPSGTAVTNLNVAVNSRVKDGDGWKDGETSFYRVSVWREEGQHIAESLSKGDRVVVVGKLTVRTWEGVDGAKRKELDVNADEVGASMRWATVKVSKVHGGDSKGSSRPADSKPSGGGGFNDEPPF